MNRIDYREIALLGVVAGLRGMAAPALLSRRLDQTLARSRLSMLLSVLAAGELIVDKLPVTPARTRPLPLLGRFISGAISGAVLGRMRRRNVAAAALVGGASAVGAAWSAYHLRRGLSKRLPDPLVGILEDALVLALGNRMSNRET